MSKKEIFDWTKIAKDYITSEKSIQDISDKYGISHKTVGVRAKREQWTRQREEYRRNLSCRVNERAIREQSDQIIKWQDQVNKACDNAIKALLAQSDEAQKLPPTQLQAWLKALETAMRIRREMAGYISPADLAKIEIAKKDLEIRQEEHERNMALNAESKEPITITIDDEMEKYAK